MNGIGWAVEQMVDGKSVARAGWNGKGMRLYHMNPEPITGADDGPVRLPFVMIVTVQGNHVPWVCSQTDLLAVDWEEV